MKESFYSCPDCGRQSRSMLLLDKKYQPTVEDKIRYMGNDLMDAVGHEMLECVCGKQWTWYQLKKTTVETEGQTVYGYEALLVDRTVDIIEITESQPMTKELWAKISKQIKN